jgi:predicted component of type VI protein secretion system
MASEDKKKKKIKGFKEFDSSKYINTEPRIDEAVTKNVIVLSFGRMNPITIGHEKLAMKVLAEASKRKADPAIFLSHSSDAKKNPLSYDDKIKFAKKAFGNVVKQSPARTIIEVAKTLSGKYKNMILVVGQDRIKEFETLLNKYNGKEFNFDNIEVVSAGARDPDSEGVEGMSASKMRVLAQTGDLKTFTSGLPKKLRSDAKEVYDAVRKGMGMNEEVETDLDEALTRAQRLKRSRAMKRARFKIRRGKERSERKTASMAVLRRRARKEAIRMLKKKFTKSRDYGDLSAGEKEVIDRRVEKIPKKRIDQIARKLIPSVRKRDRQRLSGKNEDLNIRFETFLNEASYSDTVVRKRPHQLFDSNNRVKIDKRFRMYKNKVNEGYEDLAEELATFTLDMDSYIDSLDEVTQAATKKAVNVVGPDGKTRTVWKRTKSIQTDDHGQEKIKANEEKDTHKTKDGRTARKGLWYNIHQKRKRGEKPAKPGDKDYPKTLDIDEELINETGGAGEWGTPKLTKKYKKDTPAEK